jgi:predicted acylesterase/phospholipase RssA
MCLASDAAVYTLRAAPGVKQSILECSSYKNYKAPPPSVSMLMSKRAWLWNKIRRPSSQPQQSQSLQPPKTMTLDECDVVPVEEGTLDGRLRSAGNQLLAALGHNVWVPKTRHYENTPHGDHHNKVRGLRILCLDGGGTRGIAAVTSLQQIVKAMGGAEVCDTFDMVAGTSTGAIISFLVALRRESAGMARKRYDMLIKRIFVKSPLSTPMLVFTTASYDESHFMQVMDEILADDSMLESRADPATPLVFAVSTKMTSTPTTVCLFRNYNYSGGELPDAFVIPPHQAREELGLEVGVSSSSTTTSGGESSGGNGEDSNGALSSQEAMSNRMRASTSSTYNTGTSTTVRTGSRNPGSFRIPQKVAMRATTAAPTVFKPILMGGELYCDGGMLASNPTAIAIHEARTLYPDIPIDCVVSLGTGGFKEVKSSPRIGWDGIIAQIVNSATDAEQPHHILEDILGGQGLQGGGTAGTASGSAGTPVSATRYFRFNPMIGMPDDFALDNTDEESLEALSRITLNYLQEEEQAQKLDELAEIMVGKKITTTNGGGDGSGDGDGNTNNQRRRRRWPGSWFP